MHSWKKALVVGLALLSLSAISAFANGQHESGGISGTITSITPNPDGKTVNVVVATKDGSVTVTVSKSAVTAASLTVGETIGANGELQDQSDGTKEMDASSVDVDGTKYDSSPDASKAEAADAGESHSSADASEAAGANEGEAGHGAAVADSTGHGQEGMGGRDN